jgi:hypothetical protein
MFAAVNIAAHNVNNSLSENWLSGSRLGSWRPRSICGNQRVLLDLQPCFPLRTGWTSRSRVLARAPLIILINRVESGGATLWVWLERALPGFSIDAIVKRYINLYTHPAAVECRSLGKETDGSLRSQNVHSVIESPTTPGEINRTSNQGC